VQKEQVCYRAFLTPSLVATLSRPILLEQGKVNSFAEKYGRGNLRRDSEFAREMLMFPLSIKNPAVPLMSGRSRRRGGPPKKDPNRESFGPERFIAWDIKPMDTIKKNTTHSSSLLLVHIHYTLQLL
jgi:hypothetical protein